MKIKDFTISASDGKKYSKLSGDSNQIHLNDLVGYNSIYGEKICHGCYIFEIFFKKLPQKFLNLKKNNQIIINFIKHFSYNKNIVIKKKKLNQFIFVQDQTIKASIYFEKKFFNKCQEKILLKKYKFFKIKKLKKNLSYKKNIYQMLRNISYHAGMIYPGKDSIINNIKINYNNYYLNIKNGIYSKLLKKDYPFINNFIKFENILIEFETLIRPKLEKSNEKIDKNFSENIKKLEIKKVLIIGASSGLGLELIKIFRQNKNIQIFATYYKNKIYLKDKNIKYLKINILNDKKKIIDLITNKNIEYIYYFPTCKISLTSNIKQKKLYEKIYDQIPVEILKNHQTTKNLNFFYPSTTFINDFNKDSDYAKTKLKAEKNLKIVAKKNKYINLSISRLPQLNTKQNLNILNFKYPSLIQILNNNKIIRNSFFLK